MSATVLERTKIQAQVLVPLVKALQAELGEARANALVRKTLGDLYRRHAEEFAKAKNETSLGKLAANPHINLRRVNAAAIHRTNVEFRTDVKCAGRLLQ